MSFFRTIEISVSDVERSFANSIPGLYPVYQLYSGMFYLCSSVYYSRHIFHPTGSRGSLSVPSSFTLVQVMFGGGMPVALQLKKIKEPSQTT